MSPLPSISLRTAARLPLSAALALAMLALPAAAHPKTAGCGMNAGAQAPTINVQGEGRASVAPDLATVSLGVTTQAPTAAQAMSDNATRQTAIIEALRAQGVAPADLQTQGLSLSPLQDYSREGQPPVITGYQAQNIVTARIRDLPRLGAILDTMVGAGATDVQGITFSREDAAATEDRARTEAVTEARRRAEVIARAAGMELGPLVSLTDTSMTQGPRPMAMMARAADAEASTPVEAGELTLSAQVTGVWSLLPTSGDAGGCGPQDGHHHGPGHHHGMPMHGHGHEHGAMPGHHPGMMQPPRDGMGDHHGTMPPGHMEGAMPSAGPERAGAPAPGTSDATQPAAPAGSDSAATQEPAAQTGPAEPAAPASGNPAGQDASRADDTGAPAPAAPSN
ncbi:SIMPL domain-containing protein [Paracoccus chinensis]|uniref:Uncharacterized conserved protein YggE, contains kinase-interacting SIMPL domain n=1 Tax=Paracoccus chinensis TaxID=525640 RepID=A0A1G9EUG5_9RHOB|nr:SIMPL domain-containing protein [Paracoccus chinensis]SDK79731.1 Uncharacterized conserved protein YggE, contains kinase-interacting SIMPL domain [Paracoccus chinensis]